VPSIRLVLGRVHQREASLDARERLAALGVSAGPDLLTLATCHRVEFYGAAPADADPQTWVAARLGVESDATDLGEMTYEADDAAALHLMRVACGLDSAVRGEGQIHTQLRRTYEQARSNGGLHPLLSELCQAALHVARELRATTALGDVRRSVGSLAVDTAIALVTEPKSSTALVVGAGEVGKLASRALAARVGRVVVANRDRERACEVAQLCGAAAVGLDRIEPELERSDLVISAADTRGTVLTSERLARRLASRSLVLIDVAVPRSVREEDRMLPGLVYRSVDDLAEGTGGLPDNAVLEVERRCALEAERFARGRRARAAAGTIEALHEHAERVRRRQLQRALTKLGHLRDRDRRIVEALSSALAKALIHKPTVALRRAPESAKAARELFGLDEPT
jgi:glutamyl-tRNA reductase